MSIWASVTVPGHEDDLEIPDRDWYTGAIRDGYKRGLVDVATALSWHPCIRLCVDEPHADNITRAAAVVISVDDAEVLIRALQDAVGSIRARWASGQPGEPTP